MLLFSIDGLPVPWAAHQGFGKRSFNPKFKEKEFYQWQVKAQWNCEPISGPVHLEIVYHMPIPKGTSKPKRLQMLNGILHHLKRPDVDNLNKFLCDAIKGVVMEDDSQVWKIEASKIYSTSPRTTVRIITS